MKAKEPKQDPSFAKDIDHCYRTLDELRAKAAGLRKAGKDPILGDLLLRNVKTKIQYAEISRDPAEIGRIKQTLEETKQELIDAENETAVDIKKEIDDLAGIKNKEEKK